MCGPSDQQRAIAGSQQQFFTELQNSYNTEFGDREGVLSAINNTLAPILRAGPNQPGFNASETADLRSNAINNSAIQSRNAQVVAGESAGGNTGVTTGGEKQLQAEIASNAGTNLSSDLSKIDLTSQELGRQNFFNAESGLAGVAGMENPVPFAGAAIGAGNSAFGAATQINQENNQMQADIGGAVTGLAGNILPSVAEGLSGGGGFKDVLSSVLGGL